MSALPPVNPPPSRPSTAPASRPSTAPPRPMSARPPSTRPPSSRPSTGRRSLPLRPGSKKRKSKKKGCPLVRKNKTHLIPRSLDEATINSLLCPICQEWLNEKHQLIRLSTQNDEITATLKLRNDEITELRKRLTELDLRALQLTTENRERERRDKKQQLDIHTLEREKAQMSKENEASERSLKQQLEEAKNSTAAVQAQKASMWEKCQTVLKMNEDFSARLKTAKEDLQRHEVTAQQHTAALIRVTQERDEMIAQLREVEKELAEARNGNREISPLAMLYRIQAVSESRARATELERLSMKENGLLTDSVRMLRAQLRLLTNENATLRQQLDREQVLGVLATTPPPQLTDSKLMTM